jgi:hypothetical protein
VEGQREGCTLVPRRTISETTRTYQQQPLCAHKPVSGVPTMMGTTHPPTPPPPEAPECPACYESCGRTPVDPWTQGAQLNNTFESPYMLDPGSTLRLPCGHMLHERCLREGYIGATNMKGTYGHNGGPFRQCPLCRNPYRRVPTTTGDDVFVKGYHQPPPLPPPKPYVNSPVEVISPEEWENGTITTGTLLKVCTAGKPRFVYGRVKELRGKTQVRLVNDREGPGEGVREATFGRRGVRRVVGGW